MNTERTPLTLDTEPPPGSAVIVHDSDDSEVWYRTRLRGGKWHNDGHYRGVTWAYLLNMLAEPDCTAHGPYLLAETAGPTPVTDVDQAAEELRALLDRLTSAGYLLRWVIDAAGHDHLLGVEVSNATANRIVWEDEDNERWAVR